jgi:hypothetical protein
MSSLMSGFARHVLVLFMLCWVFLQLRTPVLVVIPVIAVKAFFIINVHAIC